MKKQIALSERSWLKLYAGFTPEVTSEYFEKLTSHNFCNYAYNNRYNINSFNIQNEHFQLIANNTSQKAFETKTPEALKSQQYG